MFSRKLTGTRVSKKMGEDADTQGSMKTIAERGNKRGRPRGRERGSVEEQFSNKKKENTPPTP